LKLPDALPPLRGRTGRVLKGVFVALLALTAAMLAIGSWMEARDYFVTVPNNLQFGFMTGTGSPNHPDANVRIYAATSESARRAGLRPDDIILSVNGRPVPAGATEQQVGDMMGAVNGDRVVLVTRSSDNAIRSHVLDRQRDAWSAAIGSTGLTGWQRSLMLFASDKVKTLALLVVAILLYRRRSNDPVALLFASSFLLACHGGGPSFWFWLLLGVPGAKAWMSFLAYPLLLAALNVFPDGRLGSPWRRFNLFVGVPAFLSLLVVQQVWALLPARTIIYMLFFLLVSSAAALVLRYRGLPAGLERQQIKWAVTGFAAFVLITACLWLPGLLGFGIFSDRSFASFVGSVLLSTVAGLVLPLGLLVSLLKYRLYDADAAISRSATYSFLTLLLVLGFSVARNGVELVAEKAFEGTMVGLVSSALAAAMAALLITPLHHRVLKWSEGKFQRALVRLRSDLPELVGDLRETAGLRDLAATILEHIEAGVRASRSAILLGDALIASRGDRGSSGAAHDTAYSVHVPLRDINGANIGTMLLGPRPDGSGYGKAERQALDHVASPVARALRIVRDRERAAAGQAAAMQELSQAVAALQARLDRLGRRTAADQ
jgi:hypothetical protein